MKSSLLALVSLTVFSGCHAVESDVALFHPDLLEALTQSPIHSLLPEEEATTEPGPVVHASEPVWPRIGSDELVELNLRGTSLRDALNMIADQAGVNFILEGNLDIPVNASFPQVTVDQAVRALLEKHELRLVQDGAGIFSVISTQGDQPVTEAIALQSVAAKDVAEQLQALAAGSRIVIDEGRNVVLVDGNMRTLKTVRAYLAAVDRVKPQVLLEVTIFEAILDNEFNFGVRSNYSDNWNDAAYQVATTLGTSPGAFSFTLESQDGNPSLNMTALRRYVGLELVSAPRVISVTNTLASVDVVEEVPYIETTSTTETGDGLGSNVVQQVAYKEAGIKLKATPSIQEHGVLQVEIALELSEVVDTFQNIPIIDSRKLANTFLVQDGDTIVLGGLMQDRRRDQDTGVPVLMHLPFVGRFFRNDADTSDRRELLVFVTPRVLSPGQAAQLSQFYRDQYRESRKVVMEAMDTDGNDVLETQR
ncbi:MAG TPA: hypothetical protein P5218_07080 [Planctomycetota bacterium]|nr:hypothetical protein [Planctomycetota bacterium]